MDLQVERLNEVSLSLTTNDGEYVMRLQVEQNPKEIPTFSCATNERERIVTIRMPINGMIIYKKYKEDNNEVYS